MNKRYLSLLGGMLLGAGLYFSIYGENKQPLEPEQQISSAYSDYTFDSWGVVLDDLEKEVNKGLPNVKSNALRDLIFEAHLLSCTSYLREGAKLYTDLCIGDGDGKLSEEEYDRATNELGVPTDAYSWAVSIENIESVLNLKCKDF